TRVLNLTWNAALFGLKLPLGLILNAFTSASVPSLPAVGTYAHVAPPSLENSTSETSRVSPLDGDPSVNSIGPDPGATRSATNIASSIGIMSDSHTVSRSIGTAEGLITVMR